MPGRVKPAPPSVEQRLALLKRRYLASLAERREFLDTVLARPVDDPDRSKDLQTFAHKLAGSAALHGLDQVSASARELDLALAAAEPEAVTMSLARALALLLREVSPQGPPP